MRWIKASERLPNKEGYYFTYRHHNKSYPQVTFWYADKGWSSGTYEWLEESTPPSAEEAAKEYGEWQLCPKCFGDGNLMRYNSPNMSTNACPICDVCNGSKIIPKPIMQASIGQQVMSDFSDKELTKLGMQQTNAMNTEQENDAVEFANFIGDRPLPEYSKSTNQWRWWDNSKRDYEYATTQELYNIYSSNKIK